MSVNKRLENVVSSYLKDNDFSTFKISLLQGYIIDGYCGCSQRIIVKGSKTDNEVIQKFFVKIHTDSEARNERLKVGEKFLCESRYYNEVQPFFESQQINLQNERKLLNIKCFYAAEECVILEDLYDKDYESLTDNHKNLDESHMSLMLKELAKFHALSLGLKQRSPAMLSAFSNYFKNNQFLCKRYLTIVDQVWERSIHLIDDEKIRQIMRDKGDYLKEKVKNSSSHLDSPYFVICHGDFNYRNALFKYNKERQPTDIAMIDFQFLNYFSPVIDIFFLVFSSTSSNVLITNYEKFLQVYRQSLEDFLKLLGRNIDNYYPKEAFDEDILQYFGHGLFASLVSLRILCRPELENINQFYDDKSQKNSIVDYSNEDEIEFKIKVNELINDVVKLGLL